MLSIKESALCRLFAIRLAVGILSTGGPPRSLPEDEHQYFPPFFKLGIIDNGMVRGWFSLTIAFLESSGKCASFSSTKFPDRTDFFGRPRGSKTTKSSSLHDNPTPPPRIINIIILEKDIVYDNTLSCTRSQRYSYLISDILRALNADAEASFTPVPLYRKYQIGRGYDESDDA